MFFDNFILFYIHFSNYFTLDAAFAIISKYSSIVAGIDNALGVQDADNSEPSSIRATAPFFTAGTVLNQASFCSAFNNSSFP